jgi:hypothetical protein
MSDRIILWTGCYGSGFHGRTRDTCINMERIKFFAGVEMCLGIMYFPDVTRERISSSSWPYNQTDTRRVDAEKGGFPARRARKMHPKLQMSLDGPYG